MIVGVAVFELRVHASQSLKEKRGVVRRIVGRLQHRFNVSVAEVGGQETWQRAVIGLALTRSRAYAIYRGVTLGLQVLFAATLVHRFQSVLPAFYYLHAAVFVQAIGLVRPRMRSLACRRSIFSQSRACSASIAPLRASMRSSILPSDPRRLASAVWSRFSAPVILRTMARKNPGRPILPSTAWIEFWSALRALP